MTKYDVFHVPSESVVAQGWKTEKGASWGDENVLKLYCGDVC